MAKNMTNQGHGGLIKQKIRKYKCEECGNKLPSSLRTERSYACTEPGCGKFFAFECSLTEHQQQDQQEQQRRKIKFFVIHHSSRALETSFAPNSTANHGMLLEETSAIAIPYPTIDF